MPDLPTSVTHIALHAAGVVTCHWVQVVHATYWAYDLRKYYFVRCETDVNYRRCEKCMVMFPYTLVDLKALGSLAKPKQISFCCTDD